MSPRTIEELEHELHQDDHDRLGGPDLAAIRAAGMQRRHLTALGTGVGVLASMVAVGLLLSGTLGSGGRAVDAPAAARPHELSALAGRALAEVPGAVQVSDWQVVVPESAGAERTMSDLDADVVGTPVDTGSHYYSGVTAYRPTDFPHWLYSGVAHIEQTDLADDDGSYPVGSTEMGILVDSGPAYLGCVGRPGKCGPALLTQAPSGWEYEWGMGTDDFLKPGSDMEVFLNDDYSTGGPGQLVLAGLPGTDVARVDLLTTDGRTVAGHVESGTVVEGATMMWGTVTGQVAAVIAYDADGDVIENHELKPCSGGVDCEVR
ncbi:hypothetical protein ASC77_03500 [Nocardioides sp. Root1257]|uniref:hypothetical protein n=1 Tax=unclassified Nocardioides TaxID=2615069 RepID=UPI0006F1E6C0|nr:MULTISPECIES: hypothetical protein [unclassified Nocardioides]KQW53361.1 hypothetical protein ASC77_03500 [Nocardioides sp. Root1257]KRC56047.1 hypothetical protein ASE24_03500 [Nocardioides sp. Root224]